METSPPGVLILGGKVQLYDAGEVTDLALDLRADGWEVWALNQFWHLPQIRADFITAWFEMHKWSRTLRVRSEAHVNWLKQPWPFPIYMPHKVKEVPKCVVYPLRAIKELAGNVWYDGERNDDLFGCTFAYQVALAIYLETKSIIMLGVEVGSPVEAYMERPSVAFWLGQAAARGIRIHCAATGGLLPPQRYGYVERHRPKWWVPESVAEDLEWIEGRER